MFFILIPKSGQGAYDKATPMEHWQNSLPLTQSSSWLKKKKGFVRKKILLLATFPGVSHQAWPMRVSSHILYLESARRNSESVSFHTALGTRSVLKWVQGFFLSFCFFLKILFIRDISKAHKWGSFAPYWAGNSTSGPSDHDLSQRPMLNWLNHTGALQNFYINCRKLGNCTKEQKKNKNYF